MQSTTRLPKTESWTAAGFIGTLGIPKLLAAQLVEVGCPNELGALQSLAGRSDLEEELRRRLTSGIDALVECLSSSLKKLATGAAPTAMQLHDKFLQKGAALLAYGDLNTFFGGLEAMVGAPLPRVREAMAAEHTNQPDSRLEFTADNYGTTTTSATEWAFVAEPEKHDKWPVEAKLVPKLVLTLKPDGSKSEPLRVRFAIFAHEQRKRRRAPMSIPKLRWRVAERGVRLLAQGEPALTLEEAFGARLYTGPLFVKYNAVLRGLDSPVLYLRCEMVRLCCSAEDVALHAKAAEEAKAKRLAEEPSFGERKPTAADEAALREYTRAAYEEVVKRINKYTTTLHAINSVIVKLSKLTKASTVYRGVHDFVLPDQFWTPNKHGVRGGIDGAFMSTTLKREEAVKYATSGKAAPLIFEIQQGMIDRGADISFLSQYPSEEEILFNPLTGLEVSGSRVEGPVLIVEVKLSVNLTSLTIEQVIGKRKKVLQDMVYGLQAEVRQALRTEGLATPYGTEKVLSLFRKDVEEHELGHPSEWYNGDERLAEALQGMLQAKRQYGIGGRRRAQALGALQTDEVERCGFEPEAYTPEVVEAVTKLEHSNWAMRRAVLTTLGKLEPGTLAQHSATLVAMLEGSDAYVRRAVVETLGILEPGTLEQHSAVLVAMLTDSNVFLRRVVVETLGKLEPGTLEQHGAALVARLADSDEGVREAVVKTLGKLEPVTLAQHGATLVARLEDSNAGVRKAVVETLEKLEPATLAQHGAAFVARLADSNADVRRMAVLTLGKLVLGPNQGGGRKMASLAQAPGTRSTDSATDTLASVPAPVPATAPAPAPAPPLRKGDELELLQLEMAMKATKTPIAPPAPAPGPTPPTAAGALQEQYDSLLLALDDSDAGVRQAVVETLMKLDPGTLVQHIGALVAKLKHSDTGVRRAVVETLGKLKPRTLEWHSAALVARLADSDASVRRMVVQTLGKLEPGTLKEHGAALVARLADSNADVRRAAVETLGKLEPGTIAQYGAALVARREDKDAGVRQAVAKTLDKLEPFASLTVASLARESPPRI